MRIRLLWITLILSNLAWFAAYRQVSSDRRFQAHERQFCDQSLHSCLDRESQLLSLYGQCIK